MDKRRWEDLEMDCLVKVLEKVGKESLLLDVPFVCKSWYKATLNPSCCECIEVWPWDVSECPNFQNLMDRFVSEYQIDRDRCSVTTLLKFVINRSSGNAMLKLPKCCTVEAFEFAANCPGLVTLSLPGDALDSKRTNLELIGKWKHLELCPKANFHGREASSIVKLVLNINRPAILFKYTPTNTKLELAEDGTCTRSHCFVLWGSAPRRDPTRLAA
ncbi:unnamed protein product [Prunus armeniaca]